MMKSPLSWYSILFLFLVFRSMSLYSQPGRSSQWYDSLTYQAYLKGDWSAVKLAGSEALRSGIDYYYLRMRLGEAYFNSGNYRKALSHYKHAQKFNMGDQFLREMQYYCRLNVGDRDAMYKLSSAFSPELKKKLLLPEKSLLDIVYFETGFSPEPKISFNPGSLASNDSIYGEQDAQRIMSYLHAGARFRISPSLAFYAGFTGLGLRKDKQVEYYTSRIHRDSVIETSYGKEYFYSFPRQIDDTVMAVNLRQTGLYLNGTYFPGNDWKITPAIHFLGISSVNIRTDYSVATKTDTAYYLNADNSWHTFQYVSEYYSFFRNDTNFRSLVVSLDISKELGSFIVNGFASRSNLDNRIRYQAGGSVCWYPLGNSTLYGTLTATAVLKGPGRRMIYEPSIGGRIARNTWLSGFCTLGNLYLYNEKNGYIIYNQPDPITFRAGADLLINTGRHLEFFLMYRYLQKEYSTYRTRMEINGNNETVVYGSLTQTTYSNQSIFGGFKWKF